MSKIVIEKSAIDSLTLAFKNVAKNSPVNFYKGVILSSKMNSILSYSDESILRVPIELDGVLDQDVFITESALFFMTNTNSENLEMHVNGNTLHINNARFSCLPKSEWTTDFCQPKFTNQFKIDARLLKLIFFSGSKCIAKSKMIPILSCFMFLQKDGYMNIAGTDSSCMSSMQIKNEDEDFSFGMPSKKIINIVNSFCGEVLIKYSKSGVSLSSENGISFFTPISTYSIPEFTQIIPSKESLVKSGIGMKDLYNIKYMFSCGEYDRVMFDGKKAVAYSSEINDNVIEEQIGISVDVKTTFSSSVLNKIIDNSDMEVFFVNGQIVAKSEYETRLANPLRI